MTFLQKNSVQIIEFICRNDLTCGYTSSVFIYIYMYTVFIHVQYIRTVYIHAIFTFQFTEYMQSQAKPPLSPWARKHFATWGRWTVVAMVTGSITNFQVPKMEGFLYLILDYVWGRVFPYISLTYIFFR